MNKDNILYVSEHQINEMATVSHTHELSKNAVVRVLGEDDEQGTKIPHFHLVIGKRRDAIELEIKINHIHNMEIWRTKHNYPKSWMV